LPGGPPPPHFDQFEGDDKDCRPEDHAGRPERRQPADVGDQGRHGVDDDSDLILAFP
jgi:hypothetical protein